MVGLIIATHGNVSTELTRAAEMIVGTVTECRSWTLNPGDDYADKHTEMLHYVQELDTGDGVLIMTDIMGGTPANLALSVSRENHVEVLVGVNLAMLIQFAEDRKSLALEELTDKCIAAGSDSVMSVTKLMKKES